MLHFPLLILTLTHCFTDGLTESKVPYLLSEGCLAILCQSTFFLVHHQDNPMPARRKSKSRSSRGPRRVRRSSGKKARTSVTQWRSPKRTYKGVDERLYGAVNDKPLWYINAGEKQNWYVMTGSQKDQINSALRKWVGHQYKPDDNGNFHELHVAEILEDKTHGDVKFVRKTKRIYLNLDGQFREVRELPSPYKWQTIST